MSHSAVPGVVFCCVMLLVSCVATVTQQAPRYRFIAPPPIQNALLAQTFQSIVLVQQGWGMGTGFVIGLDSDWVYFMTAEHVVENHDDAKVDGIAARVFALAPDHDLAILRAPNIGLYSDIFVFANPHIDTTVWALGYSGWRGDLVQLVHRGFIVSFDFRGLNGGWTVLHNAGGRGGMSGGPLIDQNGEVVGVCSFFADMGLDRHNAVNASELAAVPGPSAKMFWDMVQRGFHLVPEPEVPDVDQ